MPTLTTPPKLLNSAQEPANGSIVTRVTNQFLVGADLVVSSAALGQVVGGIILNAAGSGPFVIPPTPTGYAVEIVLLLNEWRDGRLQSYPSRRTVSVPAGTTVTWSALVDVVPVLPAGDYVIPPWAATLLTARDEAVAAAAAAETARAAAVVAKDAAVVAKDAAQAVPTTTDGLMTTIDGNSASAYRVQADARQNAKFAPITGNTVVGMGDSITWGGTNLSDGTVGGMSWLFQMHLASDGALRILRNSGIGGDNSGAMLARFDSDVVAHAPRKVTIMAGTNDGIGSTKPNLVAMINKARAAGIEPVLATIPPIGTAAIAAPSGLTLTTATTGGTLTPGTYAYRVSARNEIGETLAGAGVSIVVPAGTNTNTVVLKWPAVLGASKYKVYGRTAGTELALAEISSDFYQVTAATGYTDTGAVIPAGPLPTANNTAITTPVQVPGGKPKIASVNAIVSNLAETYGLSVIDFYSVLVDPLTGMFQTGLTIDGVHPNPRAARIMGVLAASVLTGNAQTAPPILTADNNDPGNLLPNGLMLDPPLGPPQGPSPAGWSVYGGDPGYILNLAPEAGVLGKAFTITTSEVSQHISDYGFSAGWAVGDLIEWTGRVKVSGADANGGSFTLRADFQGAGTRIAQMIISTDVPWSAFRFRAVVPAGATSIAVYRLVGDGAFAGSFAQLAFRNLTTLGAI